MKVKYVGPFTAVEIVVGGQFVAVAQGEEIEVVAAIAGRAPSEKYLTLCADLLEHHTDHARRSEIVEALAGADVGEGLLAQPDNWTAAVAKKETKS